MSLSDTQLMMVIWKLVSVGADITVEDEFAVRYAARQGYIETVKYLISVGGNYRVYEVRELLGIETLPESKEEVIEALNIALVNRE